MWVTYILLSIADYSTAQDNMSAEDIYTSRMQKMKILS